MVKWVEVIKMLFEKKIIELYKRSLFSRADFQNDVKYFTSADFDGLHEVEYSFKSVKGYRLSGSFYFYDGYEKDRLVIFEHGMGQCGHRAYMREIEILCKNGYRVYSYDHTGCANSEGESTGGFSQSLSDLDSCLTALKGESDFKGISFSVIGHSWGAYSSLNIGLFHPDVKHIVAMSGFVSVADMHKQIFPGIASLYRKAVFKLEEASNPAYAHSNAIEALKSTNAKVLIIHSEDDAVVNVKFSYNKLYEALKDRENTEFLLVKEKAHNPNYTEAAVKHLAEFVTALSKKRQNPDNNSEESSGEFLRDFDFYKMTEQDPRVWEVILNTLKG